MEVEGPRIGIACEDRRSAGASVEVQPLFSLNISHLVSTSKPRNFGVSETAS